MSDTAPLYLDNNATTRTDPRVVEVMLPYFTEDFGNPSSVEHRHGNRAQRAVKQAREQLAAVIGAREGEILFTGSCTEANNIAILGAARAQPDKRHLITSAIEHPSVLEPMRSLEREGWALTVLPVDAEGRVSPDVVQAALRPDTVLVSVMAANNEVGTIQPFAAIGALCEAAGILYHCDLAQLLAHHRVDVIRDHIHLASMSGHKAYGPKGIGALYVRSRAPRVRIAPISYGGGQEKALRPGTLNVPLIVGMGEAVALAGRGQDKERARLAAMAQRFRALVVAELDGVMFNGPSEQRLPGNISLSIDGVEPLALMHRLNGIASFSASSACSTEKVETSPVLLAMFGDTPRARQAFRVSPGRFTTADELMQFAEALVREVRDIRRFAA
ncbi:cysteine desulfurase family protein [Sphingomonas pituitosa]|uniref:cysteine desulfurase family protein n=1 Tax=Sphingomonas pituitosa TaxID=99597 RepID=UPI000833AC45|nr:cysteine desulfurase family protein [Sphingomonas pituitosa]